MEILARTAYQIGWTRHFGPASGSDPKLPDALGRYVTTAFCYGTYLGPAELARHMPHQVTARELARAFHQHCGQDRLHAAHTDVINAFARLDITGLWGDGSVAAADGSHVSTWENNLLAETSIRYGGVGKIAYRHVADTYIALFSRFIPCGVWEAVYILDGLLANDSDVQPDAVHADTQGQSLPVFGLAALLGFELLPRIRNWQDLIFYRPEPVQGGPGQVQGSREADGAASMEARTASRASAAAGRRPQHDRLRARAMPYLPGQGTRPGRGSRQDSGGQPRGGQARGPGGREAEGG